MTGLLVSVRSVEEAEEALAGGADVIDVKEPSRGSLGRADDETIRAIVAAVNGRRIVSAAMGEIIEDDPNSIIAIAGVSLVKYGLAAGFQDDVWRGFLFHRRGRIESSTHARLVAVAYADSGRADSPPWYDVLNEALKHKFAAFLIDTWQKDGSALLDWIGLEELTNISQRCRRAMIPFAIAGSLGPAQLETLRPVRPSLFAVRGAACVGGNRTGKIDRQRVAELVKLISHK